MSYTSYPGKMSEWIPESETCKTSRFMFSSATLLQSRLNHSQAPAHLCKLKQTQRIICRRSQFDPNLHHTAHTLNHILQQQGHCPGFLFIRSENTHIQTQRRTSAMEGWGEFFFVCLLICRLPRTICEVFRNEHFRQQHGDGRRTRCCSGIESYHLSQSAQTYPCMSECSQYVGLGWETTPS